MKNTIKVILGAITIVATVDALGFIAWVTSGQHPVDGFYLGRITAEILRALIF